MSDADTHDAHLRHALRHAPEVNRMESVHVFFIINSERNSLFVNVFWQRKLHNKPINISL